MARQCIGFFCGEFDPIQKGHVSAALSVLDGGKADLVFLVPAGASSCFARFEDRWKMAAAAVSGDKRILLPRMDQCLKVSVSSGDCLRLLRKTDPDPIYVEIPCSGVSESLPFPVSLSESVLDVSTLEYIEAKGLYGKPCRVEQAGPWLDRLFDTLNPHRFAHSLSVARMARHLAEIHGLSMLKAEQAGLLHDCAKCLPLREMQRIAREHRLTDDPMILSSGGLLHALVGVPVAQEKYGMEDPEVLEAIAFHTTGSPGMSRLAMCVCLADSIEARREPYPGLMETRSVAECSLEKALLMSLDAASAYVRSRGKSLHPRTQATVEWLKTLPAVHETQE